MKIPAIILFIFVNLQVWGQFDFHGTAFSKADTLSIPYLNVGVIGKDVGTVSDANGVFALKIPEKYYGDSLKFSAIGYQSLTVSIQEILSAPNLIFFLDQVSYNLSEVQIKSKKIKSKTIGNKPGFGIPSSYEVDQLGHELGIGVRLNGKTSVLKDCNFYISQNDCDTLIFRLNVYRLKDTTVLENILKENVIIRTTTKNGLVTVDLSPYHLVLDFDFVITIEWIKDYGKSCVFFRYTPLISTSTTFIKIASQGVWHHTKNMCVEFYVTVEQ